MSDPILVRTGDGKLIYLQRNATDRPGRQSGGAGSSSGDQARRTVEDVVDIGAGLRAADVVRAESDPDKIREKVEEGRKSIDSNLARFFSLFGFGTSSASPLSRFIGALGFGDQSASSPSSPWAAAEARGNSLSRLASLLFGGRTGRRRF